MHCGHIGTMKTLTLLLSCLLLLGCTPSAQEQARSAAATPTPTTRPAPTPVALDHQGNTVDFGALYQKGPVLVFFYPQADTPGCTAQACSLRDAYQQLTEAGLTVIGVSSDDQASQQAFQAKYQLPYPLIPDPQLEVIKAFGVGNRAGWASREAFLIKDGLVVWHDSSASTSQQAEDVLKVMAEWKAQP